MLRLAAIVIGCVVAGACGSSSSPTEPKTDFIEISSLTPAAGTLLREGERVTFTAVARCTLVSAEGGFTVMVIQDQRNVGLMDAGEQPSPARLSKGTATVTLTGTATVPVRGSTVSVIVPLFIDGSNTTAVLVKRDYTVQ